MARRADEPTPALLAVIAARAALDEATALVEVRRAELLARMIEAAKEPEWRVSRIARAAKYEGAYVRRQLRVKGGIEPKQPKRPPPGFKAKADAE